MSKVEYLKQKYTDFGLSSLCNHSSQAMCGNCFWSGIYIKTRHEHDIKMCSKYQHNRECSRSCIWHDYCNKYNIPHIIARP